MSGARREIVGAVLFLVVVQIVTALGAIALLGGGASGRAAEAGAWAMVLLALIGIIASTSAIRRLESRIGAPLEVIRETLDAARGGERHRRCRIGEAAETVVRVADSVNAVLDARDEATGRDAALAAAADRAALLHLLDRNAEPLVVVDARGAPVAASRIALERLGGERGDEIAAALRRAAESGPGAGVPRVEPIPGSSLFLCELS